MRSETETNKQKKTNRNKQKLKGSVKPVTSPHGSQRGLANTAHRVSQDKFKEKFGEDWDTVLKEKRAQNALGAMKELEVDADELDTIWQASKKAGNCIKFGGGFYCAPVEKGDKKFYSFNCFFATMRAKFCAEDVDLR